ncbi:hypothetical protein AAF712_002326 [Marasmius tenuissimus]|uniref:Cytochrome P450 n=1 Tax=Marasmius tenuissimus TaxID=585030 RepID=A0ABR3ABX5_9AGAR
MFRLLSEYPIVSHASGLAIVNHLYFKRYEPRRTAIVQTAIILLLQPALLPFVLQRYGSFEMNGFSDVLAACLTFFTTLATSIVLYRVSPFHPLAKVPGPVIFKITKLWRLHLCWKGQQHFALKALHDQYGPIVRTGPNEISVTDVDAVKSVLGTDGLPKGPAFLTGKPVGQPFALIALKGEARNDRRRVWSRGFTSEAIKEYQEIVVKKGSLLGEGLVARTNSEVDLLQWLNCFSFDFMAEMMFGEDTDMLKHGKDTLGAMDVISNGVWSNECFSHIPWFTYLATFLPSVAHNGQKLMHFAVGWCTRRMQNGAERKDLWYHLTDEAGHEKVKPSQAVVASDAILAIVAGSDTTSTAMANFFWCLMAHPETYKKVREEVDREYPPGMDPLLDTSRHASMKYLTACLNESLRVLPPVPSSGPRVVPEGNGGKMISGYFINEGTQVYVPPWGVHLNPNNFSPSPEAFTPERWLDEAKEDPSRVLKAEAFIPFSYGPANCIGKSLAKLEMMMVLTMLLQKFDFEFAKGFGWEEWPDRKIDGFVTKSEPLKVVVRLRA